MGLFFALTSLVWQVCRVAAADFGTVTISGYAVDAASGAAVGGVEVSVRSSFSAQSPNAVDHLGVTSADGRFLIHGVRSGLYSMEARKPGMVLAGSRKSGEQLWVSGGADIRGIRLDMCPGVRISGAVRDVFGRQVEGAFVETMRVVSTGSVFLYVPAGRTITGNTGRYSIDLRPSRSYIVLAIWHHGRTSGPGLTDVATFYPDSVNPATARVITMGNTPSALECDIKLRTSAPGRIRIAARALLREMGNKAEATRSIIGLSFRGVAFDRNAAVRFPAVFMGPNLLDFRDLAPGEYVAYAIAPSGWLEGTCENITLAEGETRARTLVMTDSLKTEGQVVGTSASYLGPLHATLLPIEVPSMPGLTGTIDGNGSFELRALASCRYALALSNASATVGVQSISIGKPGSRRELDLPGGQ